MESWLLNLKKRDSPIRTNEIKNNYKNKKRIKKLEIGNQKVKPVGLGTMNQMCAVVSNKCY